MEESFDFVPALLSGKLEPVGIDWRVRALDLVKHPKSEQQAIGSDPIEWIGRQRMGKAEKLMPSEWL